MALAPSSNTAPDDMDAGIMFNTPAPSPPSHGFAKLPREVNQHIASYVNFNDLKSLALVQRETADAVLPADAAHWRIRYRSQFELPVHKDNASIKKDYILSKMFLNSSTRFKNGHSVQEQACLKVIRQLIQQCPYIPGDTAPKNLQQIWRFLKKSNLLFDAFRYSSEVGDHLDQTSEILATIRLFFFSESILYTDAEFLDAAYPWAYRQTVYGLRKSQDVLILDEYAPFVKAYGEIDLVLLSNLANFWKFHLGVCNKSKARKIYKSLAEEEKIAPWAPTEACAGLKLGKKWKGAAFNPCDKRFRDYEHPGHIITRKVVVDGWVSGGDDFLDMNLSELADKDLKWPKVFENLVGDAFPEDIMALATSIEKDHCALRQIKTLSKTKGSRPKFTKTSAEHHSGLACFEKPADWRMMQKAEDRCDDFGPWAGWGLKFMTAQASLFIGHGDLVQGDQSQRFAGVIHELPAQSGLSGFQHFTMVSFGQPTSGTLENGYLDASEEELEKLVYWSYEGIILPGGNVILGLYEILCEQEFTGTRCGPFIYWNQDDESPDNARRAFFNDRAGYSGETLGMKTFVREHSTPEELSDEQEWLAGLQKMHRGN
ncbi:MAG: hypothetical protein Q9174_003751 [Haloplaca sp. 1 TL-2023]